MDYAAALKLFLLLFTLAVNTALAIIVYRNNPRSTTNLILSLLSWVTSIWLVDMYLSLHPAFFVYTLILDRLSIFFAVPQVVLVFLLSVTLPFERLQLSKRFFVILLALSALIMAITISPFAFTRVEYENGSPSPVPGFGMFPFAIFSISLSVGAIYFLVKRYKSSNGLIKQQLGFVMFGILLMLGLIIVTILLPVTLFKNITFVSLSPLYTLAFLGMTAYAIIKHRFLDIRLIVARSVTYSLLIFLVIGFITLTLSILGNFFTGAQLSPTTLIMSIILALVVAFSFKPIEGLFEKITEKIFYHHTYDSKAFLRDMSRIMASTLDLAYLVEMILQEIFMQMKASFAFLILTRKDSIIWLKGGGKTIPNPELDEKKLCELISSIVTSPGENLLVYEEQVDSEAKNIMRQHNINILLPLTVKDETIGALLIGEKSSGEIYSLEDIEIFKILAPEIAVAVKNALSYEEIKRFSTTLEQEVNQATDSLRKANARLQQLDKLKDEFVSLASHELRTPMTVIKSYLWYLVEGKVGKLNEKQKLYLGRAYSSTDRLINLVNDMLNVSRIESGRFTIELKSIDIKSLAKEIVFEMMPKAQEQGINLEFQEGSDEIPKVYVDPDRIKQVLINLIGNSMKFTDKGGKITISFAQKDGQVVTKVSDTGQGISAEEIPKLFQKFETVGNHYLRKTSTQGTGLGLYISKSIVNLHGGKIWAESEGLGKGVTFSFSLPVFDNTKKTDPKTLTIDLPAVTTPETQ